MDSLSGEATLPLSFLPAFPVGSNLNGKNLSPADFLIGANSFLYPIQKSLSYREANVKSGPKVIKTFVCSTQLSMKF